MTFDLSSIWNLNLYAIPHSWKITRTNKTTTKNMLLPQFANMLFTRRGESDGRKEYQTGGWPPFGHTTKSRMKTCPRKQVCIRQMNGCFLNFIRQISGGNLGQFICHFMSQISSNSSGGIYDANKPKICNRKWVLSYLCPAWSASVCVCAFQFQTFDQVSE